MSEKKTVSPKNMKIAGIFWVLEAVILIAILIAKFVFNLI